MPDKINTEHTIIIPGFESIEVIFSFEERK